MLYTTIAETEDYIIKSCKSNGSSILLKKADNSLCYISEEDTNILIQLIDIADLPNFNMAANSFKYINPMHEKG